MDILHETIISNGYFPGNPHYPLVIYKNALTGMVIPTKALLSRLEQNHWRHAWVGGIYDS